MKTLYEAANAVEAHMLQDLLRQEGMESRLDGAYLQGAIGELPAAGLVRLVVDEADWARGRDVIQRWEAANAPLAEAVRAERQAAPARRGSRALAALLGLAVGVGASVAFMRSPVGRDGVDHNGDGQLDEVWTLSPSGALLANALDRNFDGRPDQRYQYDARGRPQTTELDDNFDGVFETRCTLAQGNLQHCETDTDGDGFADLHTDYRHGVPEFNRYLDKHSGQPWRVEHLQLGKLDWAEVDTDRDGRLDQRVDYGPELQVRGTRRLDTGPR
jgi:hypothetical protein